jgi:hypothetical protein
MLNHCSERPGRTDLFPEAGAHRCPAVIFHDEL